MAAALRPLAVLLVVAAVTAAIVVGSGVLHRGDPVITMPVGGPPEETPATRPTITRTGTSTPGSDVAEPGPAPTASPTPVPAPIPSPAETTAAPSAVTVQVLDGGGGPAAVREAVAVLEAAGYDVVAINAIRCCYTATTALWSDGRRAAAMALADSDRRIVEVRENPNLSQAVDVHVVIGTDWSR